MQLSQFKAVAKPRNAWQAIDLGFVIARTAYWKLFFAWLIPAGLCFTFFTIIFWDITSLSAIITWWLKPIWERAPLYIISREIFADKVPLRQVWRNYWQIIKKDFFWWISIRRFSPTRGFDMPVTLLEQLQGKVRRKRLDVMHRRLSNGATWLLIAGAHIEGFLIFGLIATFFMLVPQGIEVSWTAFFYERSELVGHLYDGIWFFAMALVAPFYVCAGFALYLQRRIELEGWDIEIRFRDLVERRNKRQSKLNATLSVLALALFFGLSAPQPTNAQEPASYEQFSETPVTDNQVTDTTTANNPSNTEPGVEGTDTENTESLHNNSAAAKQARQAIIDILKGEDFRDIKMEEGWRFKQQSDEPENDELVPDWMIEFADWLDRNGSMFSWMADFFRSGAKLIELLLWLTVIGLILFLIIRFRPLIKRAFSMNKIKEEIEITPPKVMFGLDVTEESLPENVVESAKRVWQEGNHRAALGILLRSSIIKLLHEQKFPFHEGNTEKECAKIVEQQNNPIITQYFWTLTRQWQAVAYAHRDCTQDEFLTLCQSWSKVFSHEE